jgi:hypothetical protein
MDTLDTKRQEMFIRAHEYGVQYASTFPAGSYGALLLGKLGEVVDGLNSHALDQSKGRSSVRESSGSKAAARDELVRRMEAVTRTARVMAFTMPGLEDKFRLSRSVGDQSLMRLARTFADDAAPLKAEFIMRGLPTDFIEELREAADNFAAAINRRAQGRGKHVAATAAIDDFIERGLHVVRELDALVRNTFASDPSALAAWESASHVERPARKSRQKAAEATMQKVTQK